MGIRTKETTEYFPKVRNCEQQGQQGPKNSNNNNPASNTPAAASPAAATPTVETNGPGNSVKTKAKAQKKGKAKGSKATAFGACSEKVEASVPVAAVAANAPAAPKAAVAPKVAAAPKAVAAPKAAVASKVGAASKAVVAPKVAAAPKTMVAPKAAVAPSVAVSAGESNPEPLTLTEGKVPQQAEKVGETNKSEAKKKPSKGKKAKVKKAELADTHKKPEPPIPPIIIQFKKAEQNINEKNDQKVEPAITIRIPEVKKVSKGKAKKKSDQAKGKKAAEIGVRKPELNEAIKPEVIEAIKLDEAILEQQLEQGIEIKLNDVIKERHNILEMVAVNVEIKMSEVQKKQPEKVKKKQPPKKGPKPNAGAETVHKEIETVKEPPGNVEGKGTTTINPVATNTSDLSPLTRITDENAGVNAGSKVKTTTATKVKNGIIKVNNKMKKGMRIMMERTNKILERSRNCKKQTKKNNNTMKTRPTPARASARLCVRKSSGESTSEQRGVRCVGEPLRTVELIKRPLELRDPATKLLYMANFGLYPTSDPESDTIPIVIVEEEVISPGGKKGKTRSLEFPLMPCWRNPSCAPNTNNNNVSKTPKRRPSAESLLLQIAPTSSAPSTLNVIISNEESAAAIVDTTTAAALPNPEPELKRKTPPRKIQSPVAQTETKISPAKKSALEVNGEIFVQNYPKIFVYSPITNPVIREKVHSAMGEESIYSREPPVVGQLSQPVVTVSATGPKKRKSLETIIKEIPKPMPVSSFTNIQSSISINTCFPSGSHCTSSNSILEELMKKPVKKRAPKRKPLNDPTPLYVQDQVSMVVPLQQAPGLPISNLQMKEPTVKENSSRPCIKMPIPLPPGYLTCASLTTNQELVCSGVKPKKPRKPRAKKPKLDSPSLYPKSNGMPIQIQSNSFPQLPYLPSHLEAFFHTPLLPMQTQQTSTNGALDLCMKNRTDDFGYKKPPRERDAGFSQSILKPLSLEEDTPLNLVMSRPADNMTSKDIEKLLSPNSVPGKKSASPLTIGKPQGELETVQKMLGRLHTKIAPAINGVQLITIE